MLSGRTPLAGATWPSTANRRAVFVCVRQRHASRRARRRSLQRGRQARPTPQDTYAEGISTTERNRECPWSGTRRTVNRTKVETFAPTPALVAVLCAIGAWTRLHATPATPVQRYRHARRSTTVTITSRAKRYTRGLLANAKRTPRHATPTERRPVTRSTTRTGFRRC